MASVFLPYQVNNVTSYFQQHNIQSLILLGAHFQLHLERSLATIYQLKIFEFIFYVLASEYVVPEG